MIELHARRCLVSGKVQGVFFRASARQKAVELGCAGYAKNLADGRVEVLAIGEPVAVAQLIKWLHVGPAAARVIAVEVEELELDALEQIPGGFATA
jgi:acylphosphatase